MLLSNTYFTNFHFENFQYLKFCYCGLPSTIFFFEFLEIVVGIGGVDDGVDDRIVNSVVLGVSSGEEVWQSYQC